MTKFRDDGHERRRSMTTQVQCVHSNSLHFSAISAADNPSAYVMIEIVFVQALSKMFINTCKL